MAAVLISDALFSDVKNYLGITWEDPDTDQNVRTHIRNGMAYLANKIGRPINFEQDGYPRSLLMDYVRYARDNASDVFETNYRHLILAAQNKRKVSMYASEATVSACE